MCLSYNLFQMMTLDPENVGQIRQRFFSYIFTNKRTDKLTTLIAVPSRCLSTTQTATTTHYSITALQP